MDRPLVPDAPVIATPNRASSKVMKKMNIPKMAYILSSKKNSAASELFQELNIAAAVVTGFNDFRQNAGRLALPQLLRRHLPTCTVRHEITHKTHIVSMKALLTFVPYATEARNARKSVCRYYDCDVTKFETGESQI